LLSDLAQLVEAGGRLGVEARTTIEWFIDSLDRTKYMHAIRTIQNLHARTSRRALIAGVYSALDVREPSVQEVTHGVPAMPGHFSAEQ